LPPGLAGLPRALVAYLMVSNVEGAPF